MESQFPLENVADFGLIDFLDEANFEQYIDLIRGENEDPIANFMTQSYDYGQQICGCLPENQFAPPNPVELFDFDVPTNPNQDCVIDSFATQAIKVVEEEEENDNESSATTTTTTTPPTKKKMKVDRSRTLISERSRRGRMKEKLYALRALVPNITKMDKASIIADAVEYLQDLQMRVNQLKAEVATLESSSLTQGGSFQTNNMTNATNFYPTTKTILRMDVFQVEERGYYVRVVSKKGQGVAVSLFNAVESLISFNIQSSNLTTSTDNFVFTFTLHVRDNEVDMNLPNLKMWIASAFLNQGFDFGTSSPVSCCLTSPYHGT